MNSPWSSEIWRVISILIFAGLAGMMFGHITLFLLIALGAYLTWHLYYLGRLYRWLSRRGSFNPPQGSGIWGEIFDQFYRLQKRNRRRKKKLASYLARFQESTAAMPDATVVLDELCQIQWINNAAQELLDLNPQKDTGQHIANLIRHPAFQRYLEKGDYSQPLVFTPPAHEEEHLSVRIIPYGQNQRLLIARDITHIKRLEQMRRDFIANISHELRTPLTVLNGYLETMVDDEDDALNEWRPSMQLMQQQAQRMSNIVNDLLMLSRLESNQPTDARHGEASVPAMLSTIREDALALSGDKEHKIKLEVDSSLWLKGISNELHSAFSNLVFNAVRYTPAGGQITIRWYQSKDGKAHLEVEDSGIGIPFKHIPRLTERFYRVDIGRSREAGGTGLGLAIVKHVMQHHEAQLHIKSIVNKGSTFICDFPASRVITNPAAVKSAGNALS